MDQPADAIQVINDINGTAYSVKVGISLTDGNGEAISSVQVNEIFYVNLTVEDLTEDAACLLYTSPSPRDRQKSRMPSSA